MDLGLIGGFSFLNREFGENRIEIEFAMDFDNHFCGIYNENFSHKCQNIDITSLDARDVPRHDILIGGFPCQSFSVSAQNPPRLGFLDKRGKLFFEMCRILRHHQPRFFVAENVKGIISSNKKRAFPLIVDEFKKSGYFVTHSILNAAHYGIPQKRERVFIVGFKYRDDFQKFKFPGGSFETPVALKCVLEPHHKVDKKYYFSDRAIQGLYASKSYSKMNKGRAQSVEGPSNTVTAHLAKVSLNSTDPVLKVGKGFRMYTPREVARIQSFPEDFKLTGSKTTNYKALGNAVPPVLMWHITQSIQSLVTENEL